MKRLQLLYNEICREKDDIYIAYSISTSIKDNSGVYIVLQVIGKHGDWYEYIL